MTAWRAFFLLIAAVAGQIGFGAGGAWQGALGQIAFFLCLIGLLVSLVLGSAGDGGAQGDGGYRARSG